MGNYNVKVASIDNIAPQVLKIVTNKPIGFDLEPGKAAHLAISKSGWITEKRPFTMTILPNSDLLEFIVKAYPEIQGVTNELLALRTNDELLLCDGFETITYKGEGVFIAAGDGVKPFISILRNLKAKNEIGHNMLLFANKAKADIMLTKEFTDLLGDAFINILSEKLIDGYAFARITELLLKNNISNLNQQFYICGSRDMIEEVQGILIHIGVDKQLITKEIFKF